MKKILEDRALKMRLYPTKTEQYFRDMLDLKGIRHETQKVIGMYIVDFLIGGLVIELDGDSHDGADVYDTERTLFLMSKGYKVLRIKNNEIGTFDFNKIINSKHHKTTPNNNYEPGWRQNLHPKQLAKMPVGKNVQSNFDFAEKLQRALYAGK